MPDGAALALVAMERIEEGRSQVWRVSYPAGEASRITNDVQGRTPSDLGVTADGRTLVTVTEQTLSRIEVVPASGDTSRSARLTTSEANQEGFHGFAWAPDGRIVFSSFEGERFDLWTMNTDGGGRQRLTSDTLLDGYPAVSPDGRYVVFESDRPKGSKAPHLWRMDSDGSNLIQLTAGADGSAHVSPDVSPDGHWVVYTSWAASEGVASLWKVSIDGGPPIRLTDYPANEPSYSPDGQWITCYALDDQVTPGDWRYSVIPASGGPSVKQFDFPGFQYQYMRWTPDGRHLSFIGTPPDPSNIWLQPVAGGEPRQFTNFKSDYIYRHAWSRDGKWLALVRGRGTSDVVLLRDVK
jgi:Tol biopolymer transport system component